MPVYDFLCPKCGKFEELLANYKKHISCPICGLESKLVPSKCVGIVRYREQLPLGNKSRGRFIPPEKGMNGILIPSYGLLEKEEVDYIAEYSIDKEKNRVRKSEQKDKLEKLTRYAMSMPKGRRGEAINKALGG
jgi:putative FmdB family regulatory protein